MKELDDRRWSDIGNNIKVRKCGDVKGKRIERLER